RCGGGAASTRSNPAPTRWIRATRSRCDSTRSQPCWYWRTWWRAATMPPGSSEPPRRAWKRRRSRKEVPVSEWGFVAAAYVATWVVLLGYAIYLNKRIRRARELVERSMDSGEVQR